MTPAVNVKGTRNPKPPGSGLGADPLQLGFDVGGGGVRAWGPGQPAFELRRGQGVHVRPRPRDGRGGGRLGLGERDVGPEQQAESDDQRAAAEGIQHLARDP